MKNVANTDFLKDLANTIRGLSMDAIQKANSGHPGLPLGMADVASVLWLNHLKQNPENDSWEDRDRFIMSGGHGSALLYSLLHLFGFDLSLDDLKQFRQWGSKTPGHPEYRDTPGVETTTGPLGQGIANAVGFAIAEKSLAARFNRPDFDIIDHYTYVFAGDGDLQEGISHEASSLAGHLGLNKLILFYDSNNITIDGATDLSFSEDIAKRFSAYNWHTLEVDGHDYIAIDEAIKKAKESIDKPTIIICKTIIGFGSPNKAGTSSAHGSPLGSDEIKLTKKALGLPIKDFFVNDNIANLKDTQRAIGDQNEWNWRDSVDKYQDMYPQLCDELMSLWNGDIDDKILENIPEFPNGKGMATRASSGKVLEYLVPNFSNLIGGSADLGPSNKTHVGQPAFSKANPMGTYIHYGVREFAMTAIMNGMSLHGGILPYSGTFFVFSDYIRPAIRMAALMKIPAIYVLTHDSIGVGEDGPTHQPIEHLASLRVMPNMVSIRPGDANETAEAWKFAMRRKDGPTALVLSRQGAITLDRNIYNDAEGTAKGGYILIEDKGFDTIIIATGTELQLAAEAKEILNQKGKKIRIVSMPSTDIFDMQTQDYKDSVLPNGKRKIVVEAAASYSWYKYIGQDDTIIGLDRYGASAPANLLYQNFGITVEAIINAANQ